MRRTSTSLGGTGQSIAAPNRSNIWGQHVICGIVGWTGISARPYLHALAKQSPANGQLAAGSYSSYGVATPAKLLDPPLGATVRSLVCAFSSSGQMQDGTSFFTWGGGSVNWGTSSRIAIFVGAEYSIAPANIHVTDGTLHQYALSTKDAKVRAWRDGAYWGDAVYTTGSMPDHGGKITTNIDLINNLYQNSWLTYALWLDCDLDSTGLVALLPDLHARPWQLFKPASRLWALGAGSGDSLAALTGQSAGFDGGTLASAVASSTTGQEATLAAGTLASAVAASPSGQAGTFAQGSLTGDIAGLPAGQLAAFGAGTLLGNGGDVTQPLTGKSASFGTGTLAGTIDYALAGQPGTFAVGSLAAGFVQTLSGLAGVFGQGTATPHLSDTYAALSGSQATFGQGDLTQIGGDAATRGGLDYTKRRRFVTSVNGKLIITTSAADAVTAAEKSSKPKKQAPKIEEAEPIEVPADITDEAPDVEIAHADLETMAAQFAQRAQMQAAIRQQQYARALGMYEAFRRRQEDDDLTVLLLAM